MASILEAIEAILRDQLGGFVSGLDEDEQTGRVMGFIISSDFDNLDQKTRQRKFAEPLESKLSPDQMLRIGPIVTMTPDEAAIDEAVD
jgi:hypothetical protein